MDNIISASKIIRRGSFKSYPEYLFTLAVANVFNTRGYKVSLDGMSIDASLLPSTAKDYLKLLLKKGAVILSDWDGEIDETVELPIDCSMFNEISIAEDNGTRLDWSIKYVKENYGKYASKFLAIDNLGDYLLYLSAYHIVNVMMGVTTKKLVLNFSEIEAKSNIVFIKLYAILDTIPWINQYLMLNVDFGNVKVDIDYDIFCNSMIWAGDTGLRSISEKIELLDKCGIKEGSVVVLYTRHGMSSSNPYGRIKEAKLMRIAERGDDFLGVTFINVNKTKEEVAADYNASSLTVKDAFRDFGKKSVHVSSTELSLVSVGISRYVYDEDMFIECLSDSEVVEKLVTIGGKVVSVEMSGRNAIYWLLKQYEVDFNEDVFKEMYFGDEVPLWDENN